MRPIVSATLALATLLAVPTESEAQFNPRGRQTPRKQQGPHQSFEPGSRPRPQSPKPAGRRPAGSEPAGGVAGPTSDALIARYTGILLQQPAAQFPLERLAELYRQRDGNLDRLIVEFERRAEAGGATRRSALVALGGIHRAAGQPDRALETYQRAVAENPEDPTARIALGQLLKDRGDLAGAVDQYQRAVSKLSAPAEREQLLRFLMGWSLDLKRWDAAKQFHRELVRLAQGSFYVQGELGRELLQRNEYERAVAEYEAVVAATTGDNRVLAPALRDLGTALAKLGRRQDALKTLRRALAISGAQAGIRREIITVIADLYREEGRLAELVGELERQPHPDYQELLLLGRLYEETGKVDQALALYRRALQRKSNDLEVRLKVVQLLQIQGELALAIDEYEQLIRAAPRNPDFVFQLAEALIQRGDRERALAELTRLETRSRDDEETLAALVDFYERMEEKARALAILQRLTQLGPGDPRHLVDLGERYWQENDQEKALATWKRLPLVIADRALALSTLGEVYLEHSLVTEGLAALREAVKLKPDVVKYRQSYALALERTGPSAKTRELGRRQYEEARTIWEQLLRDAPDNEHVAREARQRIVNLWSLDDTLARREKPLERRLSATPPDLEAGRLLGEVRLRLRKYAAAQAAFETVVKHAPGDVYSLTRLERVLVLQHQLRPAIGVLEKLVSAEPKRAKEYYQRMAQYAAELYQDDEAVTYAARAVALSPDDAEGHRKLGEMYRRRQDDARAIAAFRQAIAKNDRLFLVNLQLAELLLSRGEAEEADRLLRRVVRAAPDEDLVTRAARLSMQLNLGRGTLESLERDLLSATLGNPRQPFYRRVLIEVYGALAFPLVHQAKSPDPGVADRARSELQRIGERAVKPLLDALGDERSAQQRVAIELLGHIRNRGAGQALFAYATGAAAPDLRVRAMIAVGALRDPELVPKLAELLAPNGRVAAAESDPVALAAAWSVARMQSPRARPLLLKLLDSGVPSFQALAALGLGFAGERGTIARLMHLGATPDGGALARAAAAFALGELRAVEAGGLLAQLAEATDSTLRATALLALARLRLPAAPQVIAETLVSAESVPRASAVSAALVLATAEYRRSKEPLPVPEARIDVRAILDDLGPDGYTPDERVQALVALAPVLAGASMVAVQSSPDQARVVADALMGGKAPGFAPLTPDVERASPEQQQQARAAHDAIVRRVAAPFAALASHPSPEVRGMAVLFLGREGQSGPALDAIDDPDEGVQRASLSALQGTSSSTAVEAITELLEPPGRGRSDSWPTRVRAAQTLGTVSPAVAETATGPLLRAARSDPAALVREAALSALLKLDRSTARAALMAAEKDDPEPRVRLHAKQLLNRQAGD